MNAAGLWSDVEAAVGAVVAVGLFTAVESCSNQGGGRRRHGDREVLAATRVWAKLHRLVLDELGARGELDWSRCAVDSVNIRALKRGT